LEKKAYWNHEVAEHLQMGNSTLRRWCLELEKQGYIFSKGEQESRAFTKRDVLILEKIKRLQSQGEKLEYAIKHVLSKQEQVLPTPQSPPRSVDIDWQTERAQLKQELLAEIKRELFRSELRIFHRLEDRDQLLMQYVRRETQEVKKWIVATQSKKKWWQFWKS
jgi:DNA-binding transcriptional MerR regulator